MAQLTTSHGSPSSSGITDHWSTRVGRNRIHMAVNRMVITLQEITLIRQLNFNLEYWKCIRVGSLGTNSNLH